MSQNHIGPTRILYYQETPGVNRIAKLNGTELTLNLGLVGAARDSEWLCQVPGQPWQSSSYPELLYLGTDGGQWKTQIHCTAYPTLSIIKIEFESKNINGGGQNPTMQIVDWDGTKWNVSIDQSVSTPGPSDIGFTLRQV